MSTTITQPNAVSQSTNGLFVIPDGQRDGFHATIRGNELELGDPASGHSLAPRPDDLLIMSIASACAWSAKRFLRARRLPDDVSVYAAWRTAEDSTLASVDVRVTVPNAAESVSATLAAALENSAARSLNAPLRVSIRAV